MALNATKPPLCMLSHYSSKQGLPVVSANAQGRAPSASMERAQLHRLARRVRLRALEHHVVRIRSWRPSRDLLGGVLWAAV